MVNKFLKSRALSLLIIFISMAMIYYGHSNGDLCLKYFAQTMQECFPKDSILGRYGGDEFVAYLKMSNQKLFMPVWKAFRRRFLILPFRQVR